MFFPDNAAVSTGTAIPYLACFSVYCQYQLKSVLTLYCLKYSIESGIIVNNQQMPDCLFPL